MANGSSSLLEAVEDAISGSDQTEIRGSDTEGCEYRSVQEMWRAQGWTEGTTREDWYEKAADYYEENCPATLDGVLGGFASISEQDLEGSRRFLNRLDRDWTTGAACECGAGIGRVSKGLLLPLGVSRSDLVESSPRLLAEAPEFLGDDNCAKCRFFCTGLQDFEPAIDTYMVVWIQWVLCYLTDEDCVSFLRKCGVSLRPNGVICIKENTCADEAFVVDTDDASVTRSLPYLLKLVEEAGLRVVSQEMQDDFPDEIFPVPMLALDVKPS